VLKNRGAMKRSFPGMFEGVGVRPVENYPRELLRMLQFIAPAGVSEPTVVLLTPGANAARRTSIPTRLKADTQRRYEPEIETTIYFCCLEALQNVGKHAGEAARTTIRLYEDENALLLEVADDGPGLDPARTTFGTGLTNMRDRLAAIGGDLRIESTLGRGTRVVGTIPLVR